MSEPILQWRKLSGDTTNKNRDKPWISNLSSRDDNQKASTQQVKVSRQDSINEEGRRRRENVTKKTNHSKSSSSEKNTHITQHKKAQYTHLVSTSERGGLAKNDDRPKVYSSKRREEEGKKQTKTGLWLNEFTVAD